MRGKRLLLAQVCAKSGLTRVLESTLRRNALLVLNYHRVGDAAATPYDSGTFGPTAEQFDWQLRYLKSHFNCVTLGEALAMIAAEAPLRSSLLLTFDDGYLDNYQTAFPLLRSHGLQATFFLPTDFIGTNRIPWWDTIAYIVKHSRRSAFRISYPQTSEFCIQPGDAAATVFQILSLCANTSTTDHGPLIDELETACDCQRPNGSTERCFMNWDEAREMQAGGMAFGSHTHSHEILSGLSPERQAFELSESRAILERELGRTIDTLSYPVGWPYTFNDHTLEAVRQSGYRAAFSFYGGANVRESMNWLDIRRDCSHSPNPELFRLQSTLAAVGHRIGGG